MRQCRNMFHHKSDNKFKKSKAFYVFTDFIPPLLLWVAAMLICRVLDPVVLPSEASEIVKQRILNFVRSLSTVVSFAYCISSLIQQVQKYYMETADVNDARNMGFQFAGKAVYTAVWVAAVSLFMELLGFSTQKWLTAGGLGTVLLTLAGREIFTNFLSSAMIHATRPFVVNEWIQTTIEGCYVSGTVEHVGWWSPTIIRGEDREAVHIPNHKFTVNVVRNLSQKTHWRIKSHLAISHLDVGKINTIVADMRKVLAKNPHVEQQRLHRRVFLDNIDRENQALLILVSCFVRTSHFEEYLCVKETILLDLLRVISHHRARLATPIRTVQKIYGDAELENIPFSDAIFTRSRASADRPLLLMEPPSRINGNDKVRARSLQPNNEQATKIDTENKAEGAAQSISEQQQQHQKKSPEASPKAGKASASNAAATAGTTKPSPEGFDSQSISPQVPSASSKPNIEQPESASTKPSTEKPESASTKPSTEKPESVSSKPNTEKPESAITKPDTEKLESASTKPDTEKSESASTKPNTEKPESASTKPSTEKPESASSKPNTEKPESTSTKPDTEKPESASTKPDTEKPESASTKPDTEKPLMPEASNEKPPSSVARPALEDNIVLGVALDGSKRMLPIEEGARCAAAPPELKDIVASGNSGDLPP